MKSSLEKIFNSKFNQIFLEFGFNLAAKLRSLQEQLTESQNYSVFDIAKEADQVYGMFATIFSAEETNGEYIQKIYGTEFTVQELNDVARNLQTRTSTLLGEFKRKDTNNNNNSSETSSDESMSFSPQPMELEEFPLARWHLAMLNRREYHNSLVQVRRWGIFPMTSTHEKSLCVIVHAT